MHAANDPQPELPRLPSTWRTFLLRYILETEAANDNQPRTIAESVARMKADAVRVVRQDRA